MGMIEFHVLGAGGAVPTPTHSPAAYWVVVDGEPILMDPGPGALVRLVKSGAAPGGVDDIGRILLTHLHPDHSGDLVALLFAAHSPLPARIDPLVLTGPPGLEQLLDGLRGIYGKWLEPRRRKLIVERIEAGGRVDLDGGGHVAAFAVDHPQDRLAAQALGYRFADTGGRVAVFSGDTGPCAGLEEAARGVDLLVVECSTPDHLETPGHMTPSGVGRLCAAARPRRTVLTHQYPPAAEMDLAAAVGHLFDGTVHQAADGDVFRIGPDDKGTRP
jgi:ribonuclease BN (tRNA processing enzyme)